MDEETLKVLEKAERRSKRSSRKIKCIKAGPDPVGWLLRKILSPMYPDLREQPTAAPLNPDQDASKVAAA